MAHHHQQHHVPHVPEPETPHHNVPRTPGPGTSHHHHPPGKQIDPKIPENEQNKPRPLNQKGLKAKEISDALDMSGKVGKEAFCQNLHSSLSPLGLLLSLFGRFPIISKQTKEGTYEYHAKCASLRYLWFNILSILLFCSLIAVVYNIGFILLQTETAAMYIFQSPDLSSDDEILFSTSEPAVAETSSPEISSPETDSTESSSSETDSTDEAASTETASSETTSTETSTTETTSTEAIVVSSEIVTDTIMEASPLPENFSIIDGGIDDGSELLSYEIALLERYSVPLIIVTTTLLQAIISSLIIFRRSGYLASMFTFMSKAAHLMHMDIGGNARGFSVQSTVIFTVVTILMILAANLRFGPTSFGAPTGFGYLLLRVIFVGYRAAENRHWSNISSQMELELEEKLESRSGLLVRWTGGIFLVFIFTSAIAPMLIFIHACKIIRNAFACWNGRTYCALLRGFEFAQLEDTRTTYKILFKDHCILVDMVDSVNEMYKNMIESFYILQMISLTFQLYFFFFSSSNISRVSREMNQEKNESLINETEIIEGNEKFQSYYVRTFDWIPSLIILFATTVIMLAAGMAAASVAEEADAGFEILRRKGMIGRKTDQELEFAFSLNFSFQSYNRIEICGAGYLYYNKAFLIQIMAVSGFCLLLLWQFHFAPDYVPRLHNGNLTGRFLLVVERVLYDDRI